MGQLLALDFCWRFSKFFSTGSCQFRFLLIPHFLHELLIGAKRQFQVTYLLQFWWLVLAEKGKAQEWREIVNAFGWFMSGCHWWHVLTERWRQYCQHTKELPLNSKKNSNQGYTCKCWCCSALDQDVNGSLAKQRLMFEILCGTGIFRLQRSYTFFENSIDQVAFRLCNNCCVIKQKLTLNKVHLLLFEDQYGKLIQTNSFSI